jgi:hypothetical protein
MAQPLSNVPVAAPEVPPVGAPATPWDKIDFQGKVWTLIRPTDANSPVRFKYQDYEISVPYDRDGKVIGAMLRQNEGAPISEEQAKAIVGYDKTSPPYSSLQNWAEKIVAHLQKPDTANLRLPPVGSAHEEHRAGKTVPPALPRAPSGMPGRARRELQHHVYHVNSAELTGYSEAYFRDHPNVDLRHRNAWSIAHRLAGARHYAPAAVRDLYTAAIHHLGHEFDRKGHLIRSHRYELNLNKAENNPAFRAHMAVEQEVAAHQSNFRHDGAASGRSKTENPSSSRVGRNDGGAGGFLPGQTSHGIWKMGPIIGPGY